MLASIHYELLLLFNTNCSAINVYNIFLNERFPEVRNWCHYLSELLLTLIVQGVLQLVAFETLF